MVADLESKELWKLSSQYVWERGAGDTPLVWSADPQEDWELKHQLLWEQEWVGEGLSDSVNKEQRTPGPFLPTHPARKGGHQGLDFMGALSDRRSGLRDTEDILIYPHHRCDENRRELGVGSKNPKHRFMLAPSKHQQSRTDPFRGQHYTQLLLD